MVFFFCLGLPFESFDAEFTSLLLRLITQSSPNTRHLLESADCVGMIAVCHKLPQICFSSLSKEIQLNIHGENENCFLLMQNALNGADSKKLLSEYANLPQTENLGWGLAHSKCYITQGMMGTLMANSQTIFISNIDKNKNSSSVPNTWTKDWHFLTLKDNATYIF